MRVDGEHDAQALHARHLFAPPDAGPARVLLRDCELRVPRGAYSRRRRSARDVAVLEWRGLCQLAANGAACADGARLRAPRKEGVHWYLPVACSAPLPAGSRATAVDLHVEGMDQGWGNSGDSGVLLYVVRAGEDAAPWEAEEPLLKVTFDHHRHPRPDHHVRLDGLLGLLGPQPGDRFQAFLQCPTYPGRCGHGREAMGGGMLGGAGPRCGPSQGRLTRYPPPLPPAKPESSIKSRRKNRQNAAPPPLQRTTSKSHIGELAPVAWCDIHVAGCGEHPPAWGLCDDRTPGTDQAVRGGRHGQKLHSGSPPPPRQGDARGSAEARSSAEACLS